MTKPYIPLSKREQGVTEMPLDALISTGAVGRLQTFIHSTLVNKGSSPSGMPKTIYRTQTVRRIESAINVPDPAASTASGNDVVQSFVRRITSQSESGLDALDGFVRFGLRSADGLNAALVESNMNWRAVPAPGMDQPSQGGGYELQRRVSRESEQAIASLPVQSSASEHLRQAWSALYGREPNYQFAYSEAVYAIEAAARPSISPNDAQATLGRMIGSMRANNPPLASGAGLVDSNQATDAEAALVAMGGLWHTQRRHGSEDRNLDYPATEQEAEMAVHMGLWLVHGFQSALFHT